MGDVNDFEYELGTLADADIAEEKRPEIRQFAQEKNSSLLDRHSTSRFTGGR